MPWTLHHCLNSRFSCPPGKFAQNYELHELCPVRGIIYASRSHAVSEAYCNVVLLQNFKEIVKFSVEGIILSIMYHPSDEKGPTPADNIKYSLGILEPLEGVEINTRVNGHEIHSVFCMFSDGIEHIIRGHVNHCVLFHRGLIYRDGAEGEFCMVHELFPYPIEVSTGG